jgi:GH24 family phage-related lysozyme (muramidase)
MRAVSIAIACCALGVASTDAACDARALITKHEGSKSCVYTDTMGHPTVGIGYNLDLGSAPAALAKCGADYSKVRAGTQCLTSTQIQCLFTPSYNTAVSGAQQLVSSYNSLCCNVQEVMTDMTYNMGVGTFGTFKQFIALINQGKWADAAQDGKGTAWCRQVGGRCTEDMGMVAKGCGGPGPGPSPGPDSCCSCVQGGGGKACASKCSSHGASCTNCINGGGGKACGSKDCGCSFLRGSDSQIAEA